MKKPKRVVLALVWIAVVGVLGAILQTAFVVTIEWLQLKQNRGLADGYGIASSDSDTLVVFFSRSGNTELMAREIAKVRNARVAEIVADDYRIGLVGWLNAMKDARTKTAVVAPKFYDLSRYKTIYVGSPVWLYSPAPPVWEFVRANDLTGKRVILFNSLNSKFEQTYIDAFADLVRQRGGIFHAHLHVTRGRMTRQLEVGEFLSLTRRALADENVQTLKNGAVRK